MRPDCHQAGLSVATTNTIARTTVTACEKRSQSLRIASKDYPALALVRAIQSPITCSSTGSGSAP